MLRVHDIHPLTGFLREHKAHLQRLRETGRPEVLTVNGKARVIVQDAEAYQRMLDLIDEVDTQNILRTRLASLSRDKDSVPADRVLEDIRERLGMDPA